MQALWNNRWYRLHRRRDECCVDVKLHTSDVRIFFRKCKNKMVNEKHMAKKALFIRLKHPTATIGSSQVSLLPLLYVINILQIVALHSYKITHFHLTMYTFIHIHRYEVFGICFIYFFAYAKGATNENTYSLALGHTTITDNYNRLQLLVTPVLCLW